MADPKLYNLAWKGGGERGGVSNLGTLEALHDLGQLDDLQKTVGSSAGACTALGVALHYPMSDFHDFIMKMNSKTILDHGFLDTVADCVQHPTHIFDHVKEAAESFGKSVLGAFKKIKEIPDAVRHIGRGYFLKKFSLYKGDKALESIQQFIRHGIEQAIKIHPEISTLLAPNQDLGTITFAQFDAIAKRYPDLHFVSATFTALNVTSKKVVHFNAKTHGEMPLALAARASMSIPLVFEPIKYQGEYYIDGGVGDDFPIDEYDEHGEPNMHTLGVRVDTAEQMKTLLWQAPANHPNFSLFGSMVNLITGVNYTGQMDKEAHSTYARDGFRTIQTPDLGYGMLNFNLDDKTKTDLIDSAYITTIAWFHLYRPDAIKNLNPGNSKRLGECLTHLHDRYEQEVKKSPTNKSQFAYDYEVCKEIYDKVTAPQPKPSQKASVSDTFEDEETRIKVQRSIPK